MDHVYVQKIREGDLKSLSYLIDKYKNTAFSMAYKILKNKLDAEEIVQDSFLKAYNSINQFKGESKFSTWLFKIVFNTAISKSRIKLIKTIDVDSISRLENIDNSYVNDSINKLDQDNKKAIFELVLNKLNPLEYTFVVLYYYDDKDINDICKIMNKTKSSVKTSLFRIRKKIYIELCKTLKLELNELRYG